MGVVYGLADPLVNAIFYVGATSKATPHRRMRDHVRKALKGSEREVHRFIRRLGRDPVVVVLAEVPVEALADAERREIARLRAKGLAECNLRPGPTGEAAQW